jgi:2'-phosphotransferase
MSSNSGCGVIVFNKRLETILVESFKGKNNCSFPKGRKDYEDESDLDCALRELREETGLTPADITILNGGNIFAVEPIKKHQIGYFIALFNGDSSFSFTYDSKELKDRPYWANREVVLTKFYSGTRSEIYENAYRYMSGYLSGKYNVQIEPDAIVQIVEPKEKVPVKKSWANIVGKPQAVQQPSPSIKLSPAKKVRATTLDDRQCTQIGKTLSWLLRHGLDERGITMRSDAYVLLDDVMAQREFSDLSVQDIEYIVETNSKKRYSLLNEDGVLFIKANQGHSASVGEQIDQTQAFEVITVPFEKCIHGTDKKSWKLIEKTGLKRMARQHIHFTRSEPSDSTVISGARSSSTVLIYIDMARAMADGIVFYLSSNGVILTEGVDGTLDPKYIANVVIRK